MKKLSMTLIMLLGSMFIISSCKKDSDHHTMDNQDFVTQASSANMFEIAAGNLAINNSTNANVTAFGNHMIIDHGQTGAQMATLASQKGWTVPTTMLAKHQTNLNTLTSLTGAAFDKQFAVIMVTSHQGTIALFENAGGDAGVRDGDLRSFANNKLPTLKEHLTSAQTLQTQVNQ
jgi:putative membrane protein